MAGESLKGNRVNIFGNGSTFPIPKSRWHLWSWIVKSNKVYRGTMNWTFTYRHETNKNYYGFHCWLSDTKHCYFTVWESMMVWPLCGHAFMDTTKAHRNSDNFLSLWLVNSLQSFSFIEEYILHLSLSHHSSFWLKLYVIKWRFHIEFWINLICTIAEEIVTIEREVDEWDF